MADTIVVGGDEAATPEVRDFLETGKKAMWEGIKQAKEGQRVGHISKAIQDIVEGKGYSVVRTLVGHGVGKELHEEARSSWIFAWKNREAHHFLKQE